MLSKADLAKALEGGLAGLFQAITERFLARGDHQGNAQATGALGAVQAGLDELGKMGIHLGLTSEIKTAEPAAFPKMVYKGGSEPKVVESEEELSKATGEGWQTTQGGAPAPAPATPAPPKPGPAAAPVIKPAGP